jgi:hypothetical protein
MLNMQLNVTAAQLRRAVKIKQRIERLEQDLTRLLGSQGVSGRSFSAGRPAARVMSPEAKARIIAAQKKRWAAWRKEQKASA